MTLPFPHPSALQPGLTLSRCTPADVQGMASVFLAAFAGSDFTYWWSPSLPAMRAWNTARFAARFRDPRTQQFKVVDDASGDVVAFAKWVPPRPMVGLRRGFVVYDEAGREVKGDGVGVEKGEGDGSGDGEKWRKITAPPEGADHELYYEFFEGLKRMGEKWDTKNKLVLSIICANPAYQGRGIASALIKSVLDVADTEGIPAYLEALPLAAPLYRRHGFTTIDKLEYDMSKTGREGKAVLDIMIREPQGAPEKA
ncbi:acyl-CoA N-acyltransferase [Whalleya microplaca]|nr:acyl-CoA N-acyltransferase [Whalleya microplaca]